MDDLPDKSYSFPTQGISTYGMLTYTMMFLFSTQSFRQPASTPSIHLNPLITSRLVLRQTSSQITILRLRSPSFSFSSFSTYNRLRPTPIISIHLRPSLALSCSQATFLTSGPFPLRSNNLLNAPTAHSSHDTIRHTMLHLLTSSSCF